MKHGYLLFFIRISSILISAVMAALSMNAECYLMLIFEVMVIVILVVSSNINITVIGRPFKNENEKQGKSSKRWLNLLYLMTV